MSFLENAAASTDVIADVPCRIDIVERDAIYELLADKYALEIDELYS
jgi:hypothetical protein